jgi:predicted TIM-barrel fold metal-dependent hydrolase
MPNDGLIDVHAHFTTDRYIAAAKAAGHVEPDGMPEPYWPRWHVDEHLRMMDRNGIRKSILSISSPGVHFGDDRSARTLAAEMNDVAAEIAATRPDRFGFFASLPMPDMEGALHELPRALDELAADGVILMTNSNGRYLGDERLTPLLAELDRRRAVVALHPTSTPHHEVVDLDRPRPMLEFLFDTARTVVDYMLSGQANRYPNLKLLIPHAAGVLPLLAERVELFRTVAGEPADRHTFAEFLASCYFDLAGPPRQGQLDALATIAPTDHVLYGSDYAWSRAELVEDALSKLDRLAGPAAAWRTVTTANAKSLLGI